MIVSVEVQQYQYHVSNRIVKCVCVCVYSTVISAENTFTRQTKVVGSKEICILAL